MYHYYDGYGDFWSKLMAPIKKVGGQVERAVIRPVVKPITHTLAQVEKHVIRPTIGSKGIGKPLATAAKQLEKYVIQPLILKPFVKPIAKVMPKITIGGHRYDLGGHQLLQKSTTGAIAGTLTGGFPYGTVAGAIAGSLQKGRPDVLKGLIAGAAAGYVSTLVGPGANVPGTGMTQAQMLAAGATPQQVAEIVAAANAPGGFVANAALMPNVGTIPGTGMTAGEMAAAGASNADIQAVIANAYTEIPGTGMTPSQMMDAGATPQQVAQIQEAANAPGGIMNPDNAYLMPDVGGAIPGEAGGGLTAEEIASGIGVAAKGVDIAGKVGLLGKKPPATATPGVPPAEASILGSPYIWPIAIVLASVAGLVALKMNKER